MRQAPQPTTTLIEKYLTGSYSASFWRPGHTGQAIPVWTIFTTTSTTATTR